jgi:quercetin dioxygenase-like cupin family protein
MRLLRLPPEARRAITRHGSQGAAGALLARDDGATTVVCIALESGGYLGRHPATDDQLFIIIAGSGEVSGEDGAGQAIVAGMAAFWRAGEPHETRAGPVGLLAIVIEGPDTRTY